jgi:EmrB/QacA subfamily drug resistance transporter
MSEPDTGRRTAEASGRAPATRPPAAGAAGGAGDEPPAPHRWQALAVCLVAAFMTLLDISIVNVALPAIRIGLHTSDSALQWVLSGYALTFGLALIPAGRLGDARSRRMVFMTGLALFTATSALVGAAQNEQWLVGGRLIQGVAGGILIPQVSGFVQELFRGAERGKAFGLLGAVIGISTAVGPLLGGLLIQAFGEDEGWRWVFYVNLPIGILALPVAYRLLPAPGERERKAREPGGERRGRGVFDPLGVLLLGCGTVLLLLPFVEEQQWHGSGKWLLLIVAAVLLTAFTFWELRYARRGGEPVVNMTLFRARSFSLGSLLSLLYFAGFTAIFFILTLYLQSGLHYSALDAGLATTPFALGSGGAAAFGGRIVDRVGRPLVVVGLIMVGIGLAGTALAVHIAGNDRVVGWLTLAPLLFAGLGSGLVISPNQTLTLREVDVARAGSAGGVLQTGQRIGSAMGIAAVGSLFFSHIAADPRDWAGAFTKGITAAIGFVIAALLVALYDVLGGRHHGHWRSHQGAHAQQD